MGTRTTTVDAAGKLAATLLVIVCSFIAFALAQPYPQLATWKLVVKLYSLALSLLAAVLNCIVFVTPANPSLSPLAFIVFGGSIGSFVTLLAAFIASAMCPPPRDRVAVALRQQRKLATLGNTNPLSRTRGWERVVMRPMLPSVAVRASVSAAESNLANHAQPARTTRRVARMSLMSSSADETTSVDAGGAVQNGRWFPTCWLRVGERSRCHCRSNDRCNNAEPHCAIGTLAEWWWWRARRSSESICHVPARTAAGAATGTTRCNDSVTEDCSGE